MACRSKDYGRLSENYAKNVLIAKGFKILESNFRTKFGEIDIIAKKKSKTYFVEVKSRNNLKKGYPQESVDRKKLFKIVKAIQYYNLIHNIDERNERIIIFSLLINDDEIIKDEIIDTSYSDF